MTDVDKLELHGSDAMQRAFQMLEFYDEDVVEGVTIEIHKSPNESTQLSDFSKQRAESAETESRRTEEVTEDEEESEREEGTIKPNTSHHVVLYKLHELANNEEYVPGKEVRERAEGISESSVYPALTKLWERKLVDRTEDGDGAYAYKVSAHGEKTLQEIGEPNT